MEISGRIKLSDDFFAKNAVSSENISNSIKIKREFGFHLKVIVCKFR